MLPCQDCSKAALNQILIRPIAATPQSENFFRPKMERACPNRNPGDPDGVKWHAETAMPLPNLNLVF